MEKSNSYLIRFININCIFFGRYFVTEDCEPTHISLIFQEPPPQLSSSSVSPSSMRSVTPLSNFLGEQGSSTTRCPALHEEQRKPMFRTPGKFGHPNASAIQSNHTSDHMRFSSWELSVWRVRPKFLRTRRK